MTTRRPRDNAPQRLWTVLRRRQGVASLGLAIPLAAILALAVGLPPLYQAKSVVLVEAPLVPATTPEDVEARVNKLTQENFSRPRLLALVDQYGLYPQERKVSPDAAADAMRRDITVDTEKAERGGGRISIAVEMKVRATDPKKAAELANALASYYVDAERQQRDAQLKAVAVQLDEMAKHLSQQEAKIAAFQKEHLAELPQQLTLHLASIDSLNTQLDTIRRSRAAAMDRSRTLTRQLISPAGAAPDPVVRDGPEAQLARLEQTYKELSLRYTADHPDVQRVKREINIIRSQGSGKNADASTSDPLRGRAVRDLQSLQGEIGSLSSEQRRVEQQLAQLQAMALNAPRVAQELAALLPPYEAAQSSYHDLLRRYEELRLTQGQEAAGPFRVLESAMVPTTAAVPNRPRLALAGLVLALLCAAGVVVLAERLDGTFHEATDLKLFSRLPILATIPHIVTASDKSRSRWRTFLHTCGALVAIAGVAYSMYLFSHQNDALVRLLVRGAP